MPSAIIFTFSSSEYLAVRDYLIDQRKELYLQGSDYESGKFISGDAFWDVAVLRIGVVDASFTISIQQLITHLNPDIILVIDTATGVENIAIGDIVASTTVYRYVSGRIEETISFATDTDLHSSVLMQQASIETGELNWLQRSPFVPSTIPRVFVAPIAVMERGNHLIQSEFPQSFQSNNTDILTVSTARLGFFDVVHVSQQYSSLIIQGISDLIHEEVKPDEESLQVNAARNASAFAFEVLAKLRSQNRLSLDREAKPLQDSRTTQNNADNAKGWQTVVQGGTAYVGEIHIHESSQPTNSTQAIPSTFLVTPNNLPRSGVINFCGRQEVQSQIHQQLIDEELLFKILAVVGMGGIGKTEVALQYALNNLESYPGGVCWIYGRSEDIASQIIGFARIYLQINPSKDLSLEEQVKFCWNYWNHKNSLIIFDDVSSYEAIKPLLPPNEARFRVLLTSRSRLGSSIQHILLDTLDEEAALAVLKSLTDDDRIQQELPIAKQICDWLGYLPLGLELVGRYLGRRDELSLMVLQQRLEDKGLLARAISQAEQDMTRPTGVSATFELSWAELSEEAKSLAYALCWFAQSPIPWRLVQRCLSIWDDEDLEDLREDSLLSSHLLHRNGDDEFRLHQLVREFLREKTHEINQASEIQRLIANGLSSIAKEIPESLTQIELLQLGSTIPHITEVTANLSFQADTNYFTYSFQGLGRYFEGQGFYSQAAEIYNRCLALAKERYGERHINVADSMSGLASIYYIQGSYEEAETLQREALLIKTSLLGEEHLEIADLMNNLALTLEEKDNYIEAEDLYIRSMSIREYSLGRQHTDFTDSLNNLAVLYNAQGRHIEAEQLLLEALETRRIILGEKHPRVATSLNNLASCYYDQQRFEDAEELYSQALNLYKLVHQREHRDIAIALNNLAQVYSEQEKYSAAVPLLQEALDIQEAILGSEHPDVATALNNLASLYEDLGRKHEAGTLYKDTLAMRRKLLGNESIDVAISLNNLARFLHMNEQYVQAEPLYVESLEILQQKLEAGHQLLEKISDNLNELRSFLEQQDDEELP